MFIVIVDSEIPPAQGGRMYRNFTIAIYELMIVILFRILSMTMKGSLFRACDYGILTLKGSNVIECGSGNSDPEGVECDKQSFN